MTRAEINQIENNRKINKAKSWFFKQLKLLIPRKNKKKKYSLPMLGVHKRTSPKTLINVKR